LEKAYRKSLVQSKNQTGDKQASIYDKFASGQTVEIFCGHNAHAVQLKNFRSDSSNLATLRNALSNAQGANLLMKTGTPGEGGGKTKDLPPHVPHGHAFAILGYDDKNDLVHVWNPWGNNFTPQGPDGLENGYKTQTGQFFVPLKEFVEIFNVINFETKSPYRD